MSKRKPDESVAAPDTMSKRKAPDTTSNRNTDISSFLTQLGDYEKNVTNNPFKAKAYKKAAHTVAGLDFQITSGTEATKLPGIGKQIGKKIDEFLSTGKLRKLEKIGADETSTAISLLTRVNGIGPVAARGFVDRGIRTLEDLGAIKDTLTNAQQIGLKYFSDFEERIPRSEIDEFRELCVKEFHGYDDKLRMEICGSYRRGKESSFDVDILVCHPDFTSQLKEPAKGTLSRLVEHLTARGLVTDTLSVGAVKFMGVGCLPRVGRPRRLDMRLIPVEGYWCGVLYFTGSDIFNQEMRAHAATKGFTLNEYALRPLGQLGHPGEPLAVNSEEDIFEYLELEYQAPKTRTRLLKHS